MVPKRFSCGSAGQNHERATTKQRCSRQGVCGDAYASDEAQENHETLEMRRPEERFLSGWLRIRRGDAPRLPVDITGCVARGGHAALEGSTWVFTGPDNKKYEQADESKIIEEISGLATAPAVLLSCCHARHSPNCIQCIVHSIFGYERY